MASPSSRTVNSGSHYLIWLWSLSLALLKLALKFSWREHTKERTQWTNIETPAKRVFCTDLYLSKLNSLAWHLRYLLSLHAIMKIRVLISQTAAAARRAPKRATRQQEAQRDATNAKCNSRDIMWAILMRPHLIQNSSTTQCQRFLTAKRLCVPFGKGKLSSDIV